MNPRALTPATAAIVAVLLAPGLARAQSTDASPQAPADASAQADGSAAAPPAPADGTCVADTVDPDHAPTITTQIVPENPHVGDQVLITYHFAFRTRDRVEFDPDVVAFQQPAIEMDYARDQPERDRLVHAAGTGRISSDVVVAVQPFRVADVTIRPMAARLNTGDEISRVCTPAVHFRVRSVFGNFTHPGPRDVTPPADVMRDALTGCYVFLGLDAAFLVVMTTLGTAAYARSRPKPVPPPPPPRHPYLVAMESLDAIAKSDLLTRGLTKDWYDALSDAMRRYVGGTRNFDAIDMTTYEILATLRKDPLQGVPMVEVERMLSECDLVKFARYVPSHEESEDILKSAYSIVSRGRPVVSPINSGDPPRPAGGGGGAS